MTNQTIYQAALHLKLQQQKLYVHFKEKQFKIKTYLHAEKKFGWIRIEGDNIPEINIVPPDFGIIGSEASGNNEFERSISNGSLRKLEYKLRQWHKEDILKWFEQKAC